MMSVWRKIKIDGGGQIYFNGVNGSSLFSHPFLLFISLSHINMKELDGGRCLVTTDWKLGSLCPRSFFGLPAP